MHLDYSGEEGRKETTRKTETKVCGRCYDGTKGHRIGWCVIGFIWLGIATSEGLL